MLQVLGSYLSSGLFTAIPDAPSLYRCMLGIIQQQYFEEQIFYGTVVPGCPGPT